MGRIGRALAFWRARRDAQRARSLQVGWLALAAVSVSVAVRPGLLAWLITGAVVATMVAVHEAAHAVVARRAGAVVDTVAVGIGPVLFSLRAAGMRLVVRALPVAGYTRFAGMLPGEEVPAGRTAFRALPVRARAGVLVAGPAVNLVAGAALMAAALAGAALTSTVKVAVVFPDGQRASMPAATVHQVMAPTTRVSHLPDGTLSVITVTAGRRLSAPAALTAAVTMAPGMLTGRRLPPVGLPRLRVVALLAGMVSALLGAANLVPLPPLDGGRLALLGYEKAVRRWRRLPSLRSVTAATSALGVVVIVAVNVAAVLAR